MTSPSRGVKRASTDDAAPGKRRNVGAKRVATLHPDAIPYAVAFVLERREWTLEDLADKLNALFPHPSKRQV